MTEQNETTVQLATMEKVIRGIIDHVALLDARAYCLEFGSGARRDGKFGLGALKHFHGTSHAALQSQLERTRADLLRLMGDERESADTEPA